MKVFENYIFAWKMMLLINIFAVKMLISEREHNIFIVPFPNQSPVCLEGSYISDS